MSFTFRFLPDSEFQNAYLEISADSGDAMDERTLRVRAPIDPQQQADLAAALSKTKAASGD
jgi:hypothetical protein